MNKQSQAKALTRPVLWLLVFFICGVVFELYFFAAAVVFAFILFRVYRYLPFVFCIAFFLLGAWRSEASLHSYINEPTPAVFSGVVVDMGYTGGGNQRVIIRMESFIYKETSPRDDIPTIVRRNCKRRSRVMAYIAPHQEPLALGQEVTVTGELLPLERTASLGYNEFLHLRSQKIDAKILPEEIIAGEVRASLVVSLRGLRDKIAAVYDEILPPREAAIVKSMILGDRLDLARDLSDMYHRMGIFHILSISGLHIAVIMLAVNKALSLVLSARRAAVVALVVMILYCLMTGAGTATVRAVTMGGFFVGAKLLYRDYDLLASTAWACILLLVYEPLYLFNVGFQLSFGAVFGIAVLTVPIERVLEMAGGLFLRSTPATQPRKKHDLVGGMIMERFCPVVAVSIAAYAPTSIVFAYHFYEFPLYAVLGNLVIMPTVSLILVLGFLVGLGGLVFLPAAGLFSGVIFYILKFYEAAAMFFSALPFSMVLSGGGNVLVAMLWVWVLLGVVYVFGGGDSEQALDSMQGVDSVQALDSMQALDSTQGVDSVQGIDSKQGVDSEQALDSVQAPSGVGRIKQRFGVLVACVAVLIGAIFVDMYPLGLKVAELDTSGGYMVLRKRADVLVVGEVKGGEGVLLDELNRNAVRKAALLLTSPPMPQDSERLARIIPRVHTLYLPEHAEGTVAALMGRALGQVDLGGVEIVYLRDGDVCMVADVAVRVRAGVLGGFGVEVLGGG
ncbi:MAG: ComEC family competence protein [Defluviitaleaceae bacterium]|nr:ComEC family competence protein [Defluviitaleaceae bacterium]